MNNEALFIICQQLNKLILCSAWYHMGKGLPVGHPDQGRLFYGPGHYMLFSPSYEEIASVWPSNKLIPPEVYEFTSGYLDSEEGEEIRYDEDAYEGAMVEYHTLKETWDKYQFVVYRPKVSGYAPTLEAAQRAVEAEILKRGGILTGFVLPVPPKAKK